MASIYRIKDWDSNFENNRTRDMKHMAWIPVPNKHDGDGYTELVDHKDGASHLGAWLAILQTASKCRTRGTLLRDNGHPHTAKTIARLTRLDEGIIRTVLKRLCSSDIGWVEVVNEEGLVTIPQEGAGISHPIDEEGKRTEGNGKERKEKNISASGDDAIESWISASKKILKGKRLEAFKRLWEAFNYKKGRAGAIDSFLSIPSLTDKLMDEIIAQAEATANNRGDLIESGGTPIFLQGWITKRRWEDEVTDPAAAKEKADKELMDKFMRGELG